MLTQKIQLFPAAKGKNAGVIPNDVAKEFTRISHHIFEGETSDKNSGRHTTKAWLKTHRDDKPISKNTATHILGFEVCMRALSISA